MRPPSRRGILRCRNHCLNVARHAATQQERCYTNAEIKWGQCKAEAMFYINPWAFFSGCDDARARSEGHCDRTYWDTLNAANCGQGL